MFGFLGFILILFLVIVLVGFSILGSLVRALFGMGRRRPQPSRTYDYTHESNHSQDTDSDNHKHTSDRSASSSTTGKKKIFGDDEGEYVDFEEVK